MVAVADMSLSIAHLVEMRLGLVPMSLVNDNLSEVRNMHINSVFVIVAFCRTDSYVSQTKDIADGRPRESSLLTWRIR